MCRHVINAQVSCLLDGKWYDCHECYTELEGRPFDPDASLGDEVTFACKVCRQQFKKDLQIFSTGSARTARTSS